tara:strand:+ start:1079 stop:3016 length:1938 start_codon:yes stop_codon:yes gene_type:complete
MIYVLNQTNKQMKKPIYHILILISLIITSCTSCFKKKKVLQESSNKQEIKTDIYLPFSGGDNYPYGFIDFDGNLKIKAEINLQKGEKLSLMRDGMAFYVNNKTDRLTYIIKNDSSHTIKETDYYRALPFNDGFALVVKKYGSPVYIDKNFKEYPKLLPNDIEFADNFYSGFALFRKNGKWGFINKKGVVVVKPIYNSLTRLDKGGLCTFEYTDANTNRKKYGILDSRNKWKENEIIIARDRLSNFKDGFCYVINNKKDREERALYYFARNGAEMRFEDDSWGFKNFHPHNGFIVAAEDKDMYNASSGIWGIINTEEKRFSEVSTPLSNTKDKHVLINKDNYFIDTEAKKLFKISSNKALPIHSNLFSDKPEVLPLFGNTIFLKEVDFWKFYTMDGKDKYLGKKSLGIANIEFGFDFRNYDVPRNRISSRTSGDLVMDMMQSDHHAIGMFLTKGLDTRNIDLFVDNLTQTLFSITNRNSKKTFKMIKNFFTIDKERELKLLKYFNRKKSWDINTLIASCLSSNAYNGRLSSIEIIFDTDNVVDNKVVINQKNGIPAYKYPSKDIKDYKIKDVELKNIYLELLVDSSSVREFHNKLVNSFINQTGCEVISKKENFTSYNTYYGAEYQAIEVKMANNVTLSINYSIFD